MIERHKGYHPIYIMLNDEYSNIYWIFNPRQNREHEGTWTEVLQKLWRVPKLSERHEALLQSLLNRVRAP